MVNSFASYFMHLTVLNKSRNIAHIVDPKAIHSVVDLLFTMNLFLLYLAQVVAVLFQMLLLHLAITWEYMYMVCVYC